MLRILQDKFLVLLLFLVFMLGIAMRPALPVDETRYLTVAWEMWFKKDWIHLSYNFEPYHHKPPLLFWLMNIFWHIFGISRWAATMPSVFSAIAVVFLTEKLARRLFPDEEDLPPRARLLMLGSVPFLIYGSLIMFDIMMTMWVLAGVLCLLEFAEKRKRVAILGLGLCMGCGVLTKGPVAGIYMLLPGLLAPLWIPGVGKWRHWYASMFGALCIALCPVLLWLVPLAAEADSNFLYWLLWEQSAGRVTGGFSNAHGRPIYFYLPLLPVFFLPWILFPSFWRALRERKAEMREFPGLRFLAWWMGAGFLVFSLISGKQPHYLVPYLPGVIIFTAFLMRRISFLHLKKTVLTMFVVFLAGHGIATQVFFPAYDWRPLAAYVGTHQDVPWAYVRNYNGEIGFYARMEHRLDSINLRRLPAWFKEHPGGMAVVRYKKPEEVRDFELILSAPYRGNHYAGIFRAKERP